MEKYIKMCKTPIGIKVETDSYEAEVAPKVKPKAWVAGKTGILMGTFRDKKTGAIELGWGLNVTDYPAVPATSGQQKQCRNPLQHGTRTLYVGVEGPQLCCEQKQEIEYEVFQEKNFVLVHQWFTFTKNKDKSLGSKWDEWLLFPSGKRYFFAFNKLTSGDKYFKLFLGGDWPGHLGGDNWENIYLSYHGVISKNQFPTEDFPPDTKYYYNRDFDGVPERMIRGYQITIDKKPGPWLASLTLDPSMLHQAWCHRTAPRLQQAWCGKGYICFIGMIGGIDMLPGDSFSNVNLIGYFDSIDEMNEVYDKYKYSSQSLDITDFLRFITIN